MRYFIEVAYDGSRYAGFQVQENANTVQAEVEKALLIFYKAPVSLTGSSRTDAGVHALQNFFHFDADIVFQPRHLYNVNALLPEDIVIKNNTMNNNAKIIEPKVEQNVATGAAVNPAMPVRRIASVDVYR